MNEELKNEEKREMPEAVLNNTIAVQELGRQTLEEQENSSIKGVVCATMEQQLKAYIEHEEDR